jgi:hypothetical protein
MFLQGQGGLPLQMTAARRRIGGPAGPPKNTGDGAPATVPCLRPTVRDQTER